MTDEMTDEVADEMTIDERAAVAALARALPVIDLDPARAAAIARRARRGPSPLRLIEPAATAVFALSYLAWTLAKVLEALG